MNLDILQMLYVVRDSKVRWQSRRAKAMAAAEVPRLVEEIKDLRARLAPVGKDELRGLESLCAALHGATATDPVVKDVAWRTFALIREHREQAAEVDRLRAGMTSVAARWKQQLRDHGDYAVRIADDPDKVSTYRDTCTKTAVYDRVINEVTALLNGGGKP